jgi:hypothetical protein
MTAVVLDSAVGDEGTRDAEIIVWHTSVIELLGPQR